MHKQGDIVLIPIPFSDVSSQKKRPVLILSNDSYNQRYQDIIVAAVTSNVTERPFQIIITNDDMNEGVLKVTSAIRSEGFEYLMCKLYGKRTEKTSSLDLVPVSLR